MSRWSFAFCLICGLVACLAGWASQQDWPSAPKSGPVRGATPEPPASTASLRFSDLEIRIKATASVRQAFSFTNVGSEPVNITGVRTSCSCSSAKPEREVYATGESGQIVLEVEDRAQAVGVKVYTATVEYRDPEPRQARLLLAVAYEPETLVVPATLALTLPSGKSVTGRFRVIDRRAEPFRLKGVTTSTKTLLAAAVATGQGEVALGGQEFEVTARDGDDLPFGQSQVVVTVHAEGDPPRSWTVPVTVEKITRLRATPSSLYLTRTADGGAEGRIVVSDAEGEEVTLERVDVSGGKVEANFVREARPRHLIAGRASRADDVRSPLTVRIQAVRPCVQELIVVIAGLASSPSSPERPSPAPRPTPEK